MTETTSGRLADISRKADPERAIASRTRTLVVGPYKARYRRSDPSPTRSNDNRLDEAKGLALAIDLVVVSALIATTDVPRPATFLGKGKLADLKAAIEADEIGLVVVDAALTPVQQRNLEKELGVKVIDRTGLILEIFGRRARTREGTLQVELAHLDYQKSRLVRSWTHLERQRGGFGFMGGPGETQIETDRRLIQERISRLKLDLEDVKRTRALHRAGRERVPYPTVALVGYTNAGKSTLFNRLTRAEVLAKDMLFATLDPTARLVRLTAGLDVILSDTVGFISDLPTMLVAAFRATLEDVMRADVILHVRDMSSPDAEAQGEDVAQILTDLGINPDDHHRLIEVWNKADLMTPEDRERLANLSQSGQEDERPVLVSAVTGEGMDALLRAIRTRLAAGRVQFQIIVAPEDGEALSWLYASSEVQERQVGEDGESTLLVRVTPERAGLLLRRFPSAIAIS